MKSTAIGMPISTANLDITSSKPVNDSALSGLHKMVEFDVPQFTALAKRKKEKTANTEIKNFADKLLIICLLFFILFITSREMIPR